MNVMLSTACSLSCSYCFAKNELSSFNNSSEWALSEDKVEYVLHFLKESGYPFFSMIGGEPSLHPKFVQICETALCQGFYLKLFSNGLFSDAIAEYLSSLEENKISILINVNEKSFYKPKIYKKLLNNLTKVSRLSSLSYNIHSKNADISEHIDLIESMGIKKHIRLGLAQPTVMGNNLYYAIEDNYVLSNKIVMWSSMADKFGICLGFDCGFSRCHFLDEDIEKLNWNRTHLKFICDPALDVNLNLDVISCFPIGNKLSYNLRKFSNLNQLKETFRKEFDKLRDISIASKCLNCDFWTSRLCKGGCVARSLSI